MFHLAKVLDFYLHRKIGRRCFSTNRPWFFIEVAEKALDEKSHVAKGQGQ